MMRLGPNIRLLLLAVTVCGCSRAVVFSPNRPPVPLLTHKNQVNVSASVDFPLSPGYSFQIAHATWKNFSLFAGYQFARGGEADGLVGPDTSNYDVRFIEAGVGYYDSIKWIRYEAFFLAGFGTGSDHRYLKIWPGYTASTDTSSLNSFRVALQQVVGVEGSVGAFGVGVSLGVLHFFNVDRTTTEYDWKDSDSLSSSPTIVDRSPHTTFFVEPVAFWRLGWKNVKIMQEVWVSIPTSSYRPFWSANESLAISVYF